MSCPSAVRRRGVSCRGAFSAPSPAPVPLLLWTAATAAEDPPAAAGGARELPVPWDIQALLKAPAVLPAPAFQAAGVRSLFYEGLPWKGKPTRVFAWYGAPEPRSGQKAPAMLLVHGGGGTAFDEWVRLWTSRGYAALAMDLCGSTPGGEDGKRPRHEWGGPPGWGGFDQIDGPVEDQWVYHAVADVILGHSLLRSFGEVDPERTGITGISWGGFLTCIAAGVDPRFKLAVPVYGCGFLGENSCWLDAFKAMGDERARKWLDLWDPARYLPRASMPLLWVTGTNDFAYPMDSLRKSYLLPRAERILCVRVRMAHAHGGPGENPEEIHALADEIFQRGTPLARIIEAGRDGDTAWARFRAASPVAKAELNFTRDRGPWQPRRWETAPASIDAAASRATAAVPRDASVYYMNIIDERGLAVSTEHVEMPPPSFVLFLLDDMRWDALGCAGNPVIRTPNVDRLTAAGILFRNCFCTTSICSTSRASILTGQYASRHGIHDFARPLTAAQMGQTFPGVLRRSGYRTGFIGKWGVGETLPAAEYDFFEGFPGQGYYFEKGRGHLTRALGEKALRFIDEVPPGKPFCLQVSFKAPHAQDGDPWPFQHDPRHAGLYAGADVQVPKTATQAAFDALPSFLRASEGRKRWEGRFSTPEVYQKSVKDYYRLVTGVDEVVGEVAARLEARGLAAGTIILFTSDNGFFLGEHGLSDKWFPYEEAIRLPLVVFDPRLPADRRGSRVESPALNIDLAPTILDLAGLAVPESMQGRSLKPLLGGQQVKWRDAWFYEHRFEHPLIPRSEGVRTSRWKYIRYYGLPADAGPDASGLRAEDESGLEGAQYEQLFDLAGDPFEERDLAREPACAAVLDEMRSLWKALREKSR